MRAFMQGPGATLQHTPDLVLAGYRGRGSYLLIEVKTFDAMCPAHASEVVRARHQPHTAVAARSRSRAVSIGLATSTAAPNADAASSAASTPSRRGACACA